MANPRIEGIRKYLISLIDKAIKKNNRFIERMEGIEKGIREARVYLSKGDRINLEKKRQELVKKVEDEYNFSTDMIHQIEEMDKQDQEIINYEEEKDKIEKLVKGDTINTNNLMVFLEFNKEDEENIINTIPEKQLFFKGHKLNILGYGGGVISIEGLGNVRIGELKRALEHYIINTEGIEVEEAMHMIREMTNEEELRGFFKNKILRHKDYKAKIYEYKDRKFHLIVKADDRFVHGWVHANVPALDKAVDTLSKSSREHLIQKFEKIKPFGIDSLAKLEGLNPEAAKKLLEALPRWEEFTKEDARIIKDMLSLELVESKAA